MSLSGLVSLLIQVTQREKRALKSYMGEVLNSNPTVLEEWQLPQRSSEESSLVDGLLSSDLALFSLANPSADPTVDPVVPDATAEDIDAQEIYDLLKDVSDPEHPLTLGQLGVVTLDRISVRDPGPHRVASVNVEITPTVTHCSLATLIGLGLRVRLERSLPRRFRVNITVTPGSHQSEQQVNKQLNDKERVAAACENQQLLGVISSMLSTTLPEDTPPASSKSLGPRPLPQSV